MERRPSPEAQAEAQLAKEISDYLATDHYPGLDTPFTFRGTIRAYALDEDFERPRRYVLASGMPEYLLNPDQAWIDGLRTVGIKMGNCS